MVLVYVKAAWIESRSGTAVVPEIQPYVLTVRCGKKRTAFNRGFPELTDYNVKRRDRATGGGGGGGGGGGRTLPSTLRPQTDHWY